ncbi:MAG: methionine adenosyltransferase [Clostridiales bacterium]|nr:methionine adenosyltransferase [Clostridiales bacterium]MDY4111609.1 methionine adenosyltransferase [Roseburia sp.]
MRKLFTSESVTEGHPDKLCDQIADAILDAILRKQSDSRVACEVFATTGVVFIMGEVSAGSLNGIDIEEIARDTIREIGYNDHRFGFDADTVAIITSIHGQSPDIAQGVTRALEVRDSKKQELGAGDQGMVFGYASDETDELMPMPIYLAHALTRRMAFVRKNGIISYLGPDGKAQVSVEYEDDKPVRVDTVVISTQHLPEVAHDTIEKDMIEQVIRVVIPETLIDEHTKYLVNPTGRFVIGGPQGDTGLTGRKIVVDTYGGFARHGGGAFSGKDPTKVDRSAAYAARYVAKNIVAAGIAHRCEIQIAYAIGVAQPVSISVDTFGTGTIPEEQILHLITKYFDLRPSSIINGLGLRKPIYKPTAAYGHFGRKDLQLPWEWTDKAAVLRNAIKETN